MVGKKCKGANGKIETSSARYKGSWLSIGRVNQCVWMNCTRREKQLKYDIKHLRRSSSGKIGRKDRILTSRREECSQRLFS